jgi:RimJ/RimL family protein N-acetyltransferase
VATAVSPDLFLGWHACAVIAETERLLIRPWRRDEAPRLLDILSRVEVARWLGDGEPVLMKDLAEAEERIADYERLSSPRGFWAVEVRETGQVVGSVLIVAVPNAVHDEVQIGWHLHPDSWGHGYASEAAAAVLDYGLARGLPQILALTHLDNYASQALARRIGMEPLGETDQWYDEPSMLFRVSSGNRPGRPRDH